VLRGPITRTLTAAFAVLALSLSACGGDEEATEPAPSAAQGTSAPATTETPPTTRPSYVSLAATPVADGPLAVFTEPGGTETRATLDHPRLINGDPNAAVPLVMLVKDEIDGWLEVYLPIRPNGSTGWVPASSVQVVEQVHRIEVALDQFRLRVYEADEVVFETEIGVARDNAPTPGGLYYTTELLRPPEGPGGPYGSYAYGLSGFSDTFTSFNGGPGQLGIHGTNEPEAIGTRVSSGCIRLRNEDIETMAEDLGLPLGTPVVVYTGDGPAPDSEAAAAFTPPGAAGVGSSS
jgi:lipoprotein-anchoring transpeptidase ErfK/SrfK